MGVWFAARLQIQPMQPKSAFEGVGLLSTHMVIIRGAGRMARCHRVSFLVAV